MRQWWFAFSEPRRKQGARQAQIASKFAFNRKKVKDWCISEGAPEAYEQLIKKLSKK